MDREKQALQRLLAYVLNEFERINVDIGHNDIKGNSEALVRWNTTTDRYEVCDD